MAKSEPYVYSLVVVRWRDTVSNTRWDTPEEHAKKPTAPCVSGGFLIYQDEEKVKVAGTYGHDESEKGVDAIMDVVTIPRGCIQGRIRVILKGKKNGAQAKPDK